MLDNEQDVGLIVWGVGSIGVVDRVAVVVQHVVAALGVVPLDRPDHVAEVRRRFDRGEVVGEGDTLAVWAPVVLTWMLWSVR